MFKLADNSEFGWDVCDYEMRPSFTLWEILAVSFVLLSLVNHLSGLTLKRFTDIQNVPRIVSFGLK